MYHLHTLAWSKQSTLSVTVGFTTPYHILSWDSLIAFSPAIVGVQGKGYGNIAKTVSVAAYHQPARIVIVVVILYTSCVAAVFDPAAMEKSTRRANIAGVG